MTTLSFVLSVDDTNTILKALGSLPYREVYALVANLRAQAEHQLGAEESNGIDEPT